MSCMCIVTPKNRNSYRPKPTRATKGITERGNKRICRGNEISGNESIFELYLLQQTLD